MTPAEAANNWGPAALVVFGYMVAAFWQSKRVEDLKDWIKAEFKATHAELAAMNTAMNIRLDSIDKLLESIDARVKTLEDSRSSGVIGAIR